MVEKAEIEGGAGGVECLHYEIVFELSLVVKVTLFSTIFIFGGSGGGSAGERDGVRESCGSGDSGESGYEQPRVLVLG